MATIGDITQGSSYRGDQNLGGALGVGVTIDPSPLQRLATFTFYRDRDLWEKKNADDKLAAQQIANMVAYDTSSPLKPFSVDLKKELKTYQDYVRENPDSLVYSRSPEKYQKRLEMENVLSNKRKGATVNDTLYNAKKSKIELIQNKVDRDAQMKLLDMDAKGLFKNGLADAYEQQIQLSPELKSKDYAVPSVAMTEDYTITRLPNDTEITGVKFADIPRLKAQSRAIYFGLGKSLDENDPSFKNLSEEEKERTRIENSITSRTRENLDKIANSVNGLVQQFKTQINDPNLKVKDIPEDVLVDNPTIGGVISLSKEYNETIDKINARTGQKNPHINLDDGVSGEELIELETFGANKETFFTEIKPTVQQTDNEIQLAKIAADKALGWAGLQWDKDKFKLQTQGTEETKSAAIIFAEGLFDDLVSKASIKTDGGGFVLTPKDVRLLTADQLKFLGQELPIKRDAAGAVIESGGLQPLKLADDEVMEVRPDGTLFIMKGAEKIPNKNRFTGKWDNTRSTSVHNVARLVLNEENQRAGSKEINNYVPIDTRSRKAVINVDVSGGGTTTTGTTSTGGSVPTYKKSDLINGGWTEAQVNEAIKAGKIKVN